MQKQAWTWTTPHLPQPAHMARWGHFGIPVLIFPTAGGDFEEIERFQLVAALSALIDNGRIKVYSTDAIAMRARLAGGSDEGLDDRYDSFLYEDVLQRIRTDCQDARIEPILVGASLGAETAIRTLCRHPDSFRAAIGLSGTYVQRTGCDANASIGYVETLIGPQLEQLKRRPIILGAGGGDYECPGESQRLADVLGAKGVACRFDAWGQSRDHTWATWRERLPILLAQML